MGDCMKVGFVPWEYPPRIYGGLGIHAYELSKRLRKYVELEIFVPEIEEGVNKTPSLNLDWLELIANDELLRWGENIRFMGDVIGYGVSSATLALEKDVELIHCHEWLSAFSGLSLKGKVPFLITMHSTEIGRGTGSNVVLEIEKRACIYAERVITVSMAMKNELLAIGCPADKIEVIYNGIDTEKYRKVVDETVPAKYGIEGDYIIFVGRLEPVKGVDLLLRAFSMVDGSIKLVIVGVGSQEAYLRELAESLNVKDRVVFINKFIPEYDKIALYSNSLCSVFPSRYEPFGIVVLEAMATETAVICSNVGGMREIVQNDISGILAEKDSLESLKSAIMRVTEDSELRKKISRKARERAIEFDWEKIAEKTFEVYKRSL